MSVAPSVAEAPARRPRPPSRKAAVARQRRMAGGVFWIGVVGVLLAGVVAINVAVLRLNMSMDQLSRERAKLRAENGALQAELASLAASFRIEQRARSRLGLVLADPEQTAYLPLTSHDHATRPTWPATR